MNGVVDSFLDDGLMGERGGGVIVTVKTSLRQQARLKDGRKRPGGGGKDRYLPCNKLLADLLGKGEREKA